MLLEAHEAPAEDYAPTKTVISSDYDMQVVRLKCRARPEHELLLDGVAEQFSDHDYHLERNDLVPLTPILSNEKPEG